MEERTGTPGIGSPRVGSHFRPRLTRLLRSLGLDVVYERGLGSTLYYRDATGEEAAVLDMAGGYGSLLLGHAHPTLVAEAVRLLSSARPIHAQGSRHEFAERLAFELSARVGGDYCAVFANSGTEAVEAAIKHAMLETGARRFVALEGAFHGQSLGALQMTAAARYRKPFELRDLDVIRVPPDDVARLETAFASAGSLAGLIFEPILGEGGVRPLSRDFTRRAAQLCAARNIPLIADECQTGVGRTGAFLASSRLGVLPDYIILSKALGGGLAKIAAVLIARRRYVDEFDLMHTSTYADDDYSCAIALQTLHLVDDNLMAACAEKGERLLSGLRRLQNGFPDVIAGVRGSGLMVGVEFHARTDSPSFVLRLLSSQEHLGFILAAYLFAAHRIRIAPTLGSPSTLRLEPCALIGEPDLDRVVDAMHDVCSRLRDQDAVALTAFVTPVASPNGSSAPMRTNALRYTPAPHAVFQCGVGDETHGPGTRVAWLFHLIDGDDLVRLDGQFARLSSQRREEFLNGFAALAAPVVMRGVDIRSTSGAAAHLYPVLLPVTSRWLKQSIDARKLALPQSLVQEGVDLAHALGCQVVSLGQYTSILTLNATRVSDRGMSLTTGNSLTVALASRAIERAHLERGCNPADSTLAVVGAAGNIGRACARILGRRYRRTILIGSGKPGSLARLREVSRAIPGADIALDHSAVRNAQVVLAAVNAVDAPISAGDFTKGAIVCDLSIPSSVQRATLALRPDLYLIEGGIVRLPFSEDLGIAGFPLPPGRVYGCLAEAILLGFEGVRGSTFTGKLTPDQVQRVGEMAARHGFDLADRSS